MRFQTVTRHACSFFEPGVEGPGGVVTRRRRSGAIAILLLLAPAFLIAGGRDDDPGDWLARYAAQSEFDIPEVSSRQHAALRLGDGVTRFAGQGDGPDVDAMAVVGMQVVDVPRLLIWMSLFGGVIEADDRLTRALLSRGELGSYVRYQHVDLPWPFRDRHWVITCEKNRALAESSNGAIWEHYWTLTPDGPALARAALADGRLDGLAAKDMRRSVYLPANRGAWTLIELDVDRTLVIAVFDVELGGLMPDALVRRFTRMQMRRALDVVHDAALRVHTDYDPSRTVHDGFGRVIGTDAIQLASVRLAGAGTMPQR